MSVAAEYAPRERQGLSVASSPGLSSPPTPSSPTNRNHITSQPTNNSQVVKNSASDANHGGEKITEAANAKTGSTVKKPRKPREPKLKADGKTAKTSSTAAADAKDGAKKTRKPRMPKDPSSTTVKRRSQSAAASDAKPAKPSDVPPPKINASKGPAPAPSNSGVPGSPLLPQLGNVEAIPKSEHSQPQIMAPLPPRAGSGQNYDPIRSSTIEPRSYPPTPAQNPIVATPSPQKHANNASASPSIASLIDPPAPQQMLHPKHSSVRPPSPPPPKRQRMTPPDELSTATAPKSVVRESSVNQPILVSNGTTPMDVDSSPPAAPPPKPASAARKSTTSSGTNSPASAPKPREKKEITLLPPMGTGNGLLSSTILGGNLVADSKSENSAPTVVLQFDLKGQSNQVINFARAAEEKYGFDALHPRLAAQRARLARVAAAGAALENAQKRLGSGVSADDASEDLPDADDNDDDTDAEMGGVAGMTGLDGTKSGADEGSEAPELNGVKKKAKRVLKEDMYDVEMDFIDDTELAWEENRQATQDGFFVYMGPLVPEEDKSEMERLVSSFCYPGTFANPIYHSKPETSTRRGRGGGRGSRGGRGGSTRGGASGTSRKLASADKDKDSSASKTATKDGVVRKPRMTKKEKERLESEQAAAANAVAAHADHQHQPHSSGAGLQQTTLQVQIPVQQKELGASPLGPLLAAKPPTTTTQSVPMHGGTYPVVGP